MLGLWVTHISAQARALSVEIAASVFTYMRPNEPVSGSRNLIGKYDDR